MPQLEPLITEQEIEQAVDRLANQINQDYRDKFPVLVAILKGSFIFLSDLVRRLKFPLHIEFVCLSSYQGTTTTGKVRMGLPPQMSLKGRDVLIVEDIVDTGITINYLIDYLRKKKPASIRLCALLDKPQRRQVPVKIDYLGFSVPDKFVVGYGLDWEERYRELSCIYVVKET